MAAPTSRVQTLAALIRARAAPAIPYPPTDAPPGSPEKVQVLCRRVACLRRQGYDLDSRGPGPPLCLPADAGMPSWKGWLVVVGDNGRVVDKLLVDACDAGEISVTDLRRLNTCS